VVFLRSLLLAGLGLWTSAALAASGTQRLEAFLAGLDTFEAAFEQAVLDRESGRTGVFRGLFFLDRPDKFRWEYVTPQDQLLIADGRDLWIIERDLEQVTQVPQRRALRGTPAIVLMGEGRLDNEFEVVDIGDSQGLAWAELIPRDEESQFVRILLAFDEETLRRMEMSDKFGQISRFRFFDVIRNPELDPELFEWDRPPGYDVFGH
jgi:outer membrane lipoprotein carrier protein